MSTPEQAQAGTFAALSIKSGSQPRLLSDLSLSAPLSAPLSSPLSSPLAPPLPEPLLLPAPPRYHLGHALRYSGLLGMPPLVYGPDEAVPTLQLVLYPAAVGLRAPGTPPAVEVLVVQPSPLGDQPLLVYGLRPSPLTDALLEQLRLMLRLDDDLGVFYRLTKKDPELAWVAACDGGRLLRAPTAFEDLVHCLASAHGPPPRVAGLMQRLCEQLGPRTSLGRRGFPDPVAIAEAPLRAYEQLIAPWPGGTAAGRTGRGLGRALRELATLCASGSLHPESMRRRSTELTRALDAQDDSVWQDALHEELEWQERVRSLLESLPGFRSPAVGSRAVEEMLLRLGCYDGLRLDNVARAAWERRFPLPPARRSARSADPRLQRRPGRHPAPAACAPPGLAKTATASSGAPSAQTPAERQAERHVHGLMIARRIARRVSPFSIYRGLAQALLLRVPPQGEPRQ